MKSPFLGRRDLAVVAAAAAHSVKVLPPLALAAQEFVTVVVMVVVARLVVVEVRAREMKRALAFSSSTASLLRPESMTSIILLTMSVSASLRPWLFLTAS